MIDILIPVFGIVFILVLMHTYLGIEIIKRQIIFTDLSVGQMAAVGVAVSLVFFNEEFRYLFSVIFAFITALLIAFISKKSKYVEAFIGIVYAFGTSGIFLVMSKSPTGMEHIKELTASDVLYVGNREILITAFLYSVFFSVLYLSKKYLSKYYDFIYFPVFALTIVHSVSLVGVLVVFVFLIVPAFIGILLKEENPYLIAASSGVFLTFFAIFVAVYFDFPVGYTISAVLSFFGIFLALLKMQI